MQKPLIPHPAGGTTPGAPFIRLFTTIEAAGSSTKDLTPTSLARTGIGARVPLLDGTSTASAAPTPFSIKFIGVFETRSNQSHHSADCRARIHQILRELLGGRGLR